MHQGPSTDYDRELTAQGVGNMICGALGALPMTGVIVRSGANVQAGAQTRLSTILHAVWLVAFVAAFPGILGLIPTAGLAAILVYTGFKLVDTSHLRKLAQYGRTEVFIYLTTVVAIVATDLIRGIVLGLVLALIKLLYTLAHLNVDCRYEPAGRRAEMNLEGSATFLRLPTLATTLDRVPDGTELHLCIEKLEYIDHACIDLLASWESRQNGSGGRLVVDWSELNHRYHTKNASPEAAISISISRTLERRDHMR
jgi:MFS superfamily sulfate permease-like transporter